MLDNVLENDEHGTVVAHSATIEWQKRVLTHAFILFFMNNNSEPKSTANGNDENELYLNTNYNFASEAFWRIYDFAIQ